MKHKALLLSAYVLVALAQLFVPYQMISKEADYALSGREFQFRIRHNRTDGYRGGYSGSTVQGKFIWLQFEENQFRVSDRKEWELGQTVYVTFTTDSMGYAAVRDVTKTRPATSDWVKAKAFMNNRDTTILSLVYPFNNYYIEDKDTRDIDTAFTRKMNDPVSSICLKVNIKENQFIVNDLMVDSLTFKEFVKKIREKKHN
jgi:hypothetical protein